jgi:hypothetical protein
MPSCGGTFKPDVPTRYYCSDECATSAFRARNAISGTGPTEKSHIVTAKRGGAAEREPGGAPIARREVDAAAASLDETSEPSSVTSTPATAPQGGRSLENDKLSRVTEPRRQDSVAVDDGPELLPHHAALLTASAISADVARARGYRSVTKKIELERAGFAPAQRSVPTLLIPIWNARGEPALYQHRPDTPRIRDGKPLKYESPARAHMVVDVPPAARARLGDPAVPLLITEGVRKADAAVSHGLVCIDILGVWNWRGTNESGGRVALPD